MSKKKTVLLALTALLGAVLFVHGKINPSKVTQGNSKSSAYLNVGDMAPELAYQSPNGETIKLSDLRGKMVLIDFWASWCRPCRSANPKIVSIYHKYKDRGFKNANGFTIYSVSLDKRKADWNEAIGTDNLSWNTHVSDLKGWQSEGAAKYGVEAIPTTFLIDGTGVIVARSTTRSHMDIENELKKHLSK